jgi:hypothetical protein
VATPFTTFDHVEEQSTLLLSRRPWVEYGDVTLVHGEGEVGKGRGITSLIGAITRGEPLGLDDDGDGPGDVVVVYGEDKPGVHVVGRLKAEGADLRRVHDLSKVNGERFKISANPKVPGHLPILRAYIDQLRRSCLCNQVFTDYEGLVKHLSVSKGPGHAPRNPRLVVGDPIGSLVLKGTSVQTEAGARSWIEPIQDMADTTGVAVVLVGHPTKGTNVMRGSGALVNAARCVLYFRHDDVNRSHRVVEVQKGNNVPDEFRLPIKYTIENGPDGRARVRWLGKPSQEAQSATLTDWRAIRLAEQKARAAASAKAAVAAATIPAKPFDPKAPWRVISWTKTAAGNTPHLVGDVKDKVQACKAAAVNAGIPLSWNPAKDVAGGLISCPVEHAGAITVYMAYPQKPPAAWEAA